MSAGRRNPFSSLSNFAVRVPGRMARFQFAGFELLTVPSVNEPATLGLDMLARRHRGCIAHDGDKVYSAPDLYPHDGKAVLGIVVSDPFDESVHGFVHGCGVMGIMSHKVDG